jgi:chromatin remodeling complex protein RSC6
MPNNTAHLAVNIGWTCKPTGLILSLSISNKKQKIIKNGGIRMAEEKGLNKPVKLKADLAALLGAGALPRTEITKKLWDYIKANKLQTTTVNGKPENAGKNIVADAKLIKIFNNTKTTSKTGKLTDLTQLKEGQTIDMMQMASVVSSNIE